MEKLNKLPERVREQVLHELTIGKICETLKKLLIDKQFFNPYKPIFVFSWIQLPTETETQRVEFNFFDCMEIMQMQRESYPQYKYSENEPVIYQCGDRFELGIVKSVCSGDEYFVNYHTGETAARTHARNLHKITNGCDFWIERKSA